MISKVSYNVYIRKFDKIPTYQGATEDLKKIVGIREKNIEQSQISKITWDTSFYDFFLIWQKRRQTSKTSKILLCFDNCFNMENHLRFEK